MESDNPYLPVDLPEFGMSVGWAMCRNPMCRNFGIQYEGTANAEDGVLRDGRYEINTKTGQLQCGHCRDEFELNSNRAIRSLARHFLSLSLPFATCPNPDCENFGRNAFEHHTENRRVRSRPYRCIDDDGHRLLCRKCGNTFPLGTALYLDRGPPKETPEERNTRVRGAMRRLRRVIRGAMYYRSTWMILEDAEINADTYYTQLKRSGGRLRDYLSWRNALLLHPRFGKDDEPLRVYTDTLNPSLARSGKHTPRFTQMQIPVSVIDLPNDRTYYILAAHVGFLPDKLCQTDLVELAREVSGPAHTSPWAHAFHPLSIPLSEDTEKTMKMLRDIGRGGWFVRSPYLELAHFLTVRKMLSRFNRIYLYLDANRTQSAAALTAFAEDIRAGRCEIALYQKRRKGKKKKPEAEAGRERWPTKREELEAWLKAKVDVQWGEREARWPERADAEKEGEVDSSMSDEQLRAISFAPARLGARGEERKWAWLDFPPPGPRYDGGHALWLTQKPGSSYEAIGRELLWSANIMQVDRAHSHLRDDVRAFSRAAFRAEPGRSHRRAYNDPAIAMAEMWIALFWRTFGPRRPPRRALKSGEKPRLTPAATMKLARSNEPRKPNLATLVWKFRLGVREAERIARWCRT